MTAPRDILHRSAGATPGAADRRGAHRKFALAAVALGLGATDVGAACPPPLPAVVSLDLTRFYSDEAGSIVDPALAAQHQAETEPLKTFLGKVTSYADQALRESTAADDAAPCALAWLEAWARDGALLGEMRSRQAEYERKWNFVGAVLAYLKVRAHAGPGQRAAIEPWLAKLADASLAFFDDRSHKRNNHWYWLGLGLGATALATGNERYWDLARRIMQDATHDIAADGSLPLELERKARALHYHAFAAMALVPLAELARSRGEDWYTLGDGALDRLVDLTARGLADPAVFDRLAGTPQERTVKPGAGWLPLYTLTRGELHPVPSTPMTVAHRWLGGDVLLLHRMLQEAH
jgi:poly(beta-D-mannuronate) lyase